MRLTKRKIAGVQVGDRTLTFGKKTNAFEVNDPGLAAEIEARYGPKATGDVVVAPHDYNPEPGHRYFFTVPELPWHKKARDGDAVQIQETTQLDVEEQARDGAQMDQRARIENPEKTKGKII